MKNYHLLLMAMLMVISCNKDDNKNPSSYFRLEDKNYELTKGFFLNYGSTDNMNYDFDIFMYSEMQIYNPDSVVGSGPIIGFNIVSSSKTISSGDYPYSDEWDVAQTFTIGKFLLKWDIEAEEWQNWIDLKSGVIKIQNDNNTFTITFDCATSDGKKLTGKYSGKPNFYLESEFRNSINMQNKIFNP